jgi:hypothetical protein
VESPWYLARNGQKYGPYSAEELQKLADTGKLAGEDMIWREGLDSWQAARTVLGQFSDALPAPPPLPSKVPAKFDRLAEGDDYPSIRRSEPQPVGQFPGRLISPGFFLLSVFLFLLPWVDVRCGNTFTVASQSGLQASIGDYSESSLAINERQQNPNRIQFRPQQERVKPAILLIIYVFLILAGLIIGLAVPVGLWRLVGVASCAGMALALLMVQVAVGFPIREAVARANAGQQQINPMQIPPEFPQPAPFGPAPGQRNQLTTNLTAGFWIAFLFTLGPIGGLLIEHLAVFAPTRRRDRFGYS